MNLPHCVPIPPFWNENESSVSLTNGCNLCFYCIRDPNCPNLRNDSIFKLLNVLKSQTEYTVHSAVFMSLREQEIHEYDSKVIHLGARLTWGGFG